ncbi:PLP-dependent aminotransferase family protein [Microbacterium sp. HD4P20]|nr:PLP-dependent aminotransferase family protein [Microbacterium sp. HD4P20]MCP2635246.1 PLP-dependent aminotransferase family protein [Microbacterium sp. HD4P20]
MVTDAATGLDLYLPLHGGRSVREIEAGLRALVADGRLPVGTRLPASRVLASDLGVARNTVGEVYARLAAEGWLQTRVGAGTWVAAVPGSDPSRAPGAQHPAPLDLRGGLVDASDFPHAAWSTHVRRALAESPSAAFGYPDPIGVPALRGSLASYVARTRGAVADPGAVMIGSGFGDLLALLARTLRARGARRMAVEEYGHERHRRIIEAAGLEVVPVHVDDEGADASHLARLDVGGILLTPAHQFPTGVPLSAARRRAVVEWARSCGGVVLEDDYDGEFRYDRRSVGALQALAPDVVVYLGSASKALAPSVGLAWGVIPAALRDDVSRQREVSGGTPSGLHQHALARFIDAFEYDRAVRRRRARFRTRRELLGALLAERAPQLHIEGLSAGLQCLVGLPDESVEARVVARASERGVAVDGLAAFRAARSRGGAPTARPTPAGVVVGYGALPPSRVETGLDALVAAIAEG